MLQYACPASAPPTPLRTLPAFTYYDPDFFAAECEKIFLNNWVLVAHVSEVANPGDYVVFDYLDQSAVVTRCRKGELHAFHNVCQHRGNRLVETRRGSAQRVFRCAYHSWCYDLSGQLFGAPHSRDVTDFHRAHYNIPRIAVATMADFVFVNFDSDAHSPEEHYPGAEGVIRTHLPDLPRLRFHAEEEFTIAANWKVVMDNNIEGYHLDLSGPVHKDLGALIKGEEFDFVPHGQWWTYIAPAKEDATEVYGVELSDSERRFDTFVNVGLFPITTIFRFPFSAFVGTFLIIPIGPEQTLLRVGYYLESEAPHAVTLAAERWMNEELSPEDIALNLSTQRGMRSRGFDRGRFLINPERMHESEHLVLNFHQRVHESIWPEVVG